MYSNRSMLAGTEKDIEFDGMIDSYKLYSLHRVLISIDSQI